MPLLHVVGVSSCGSTFTAALVFQSAEQEADYTFSLAKLREFLDTETGADDSPRACPHVIVTDRDLALMNGIKEVFPEAHNILCMWHIDKNILTNCKKYFPSEESWTTFMREWKAFVWSRTEEEANGKWARITSSGAWPQPVIAYVQTTWLVHAQHFMHASVNVYPHLGCLTTSRVEGAHAAVKSWISSSTSDMRGVVTSLFLAVNSQANEIARKRAYERTHTLLATCGPPWTMCNRQVSHHALKLAAEEMKKAVKLLSGAPQDPCSGKFQSVYGVPCCHKIATYLVSKKPISIEEFHRQWRLEQPASASATVNRMTQNDIIQPAALAGLPLRIQHEFSQRVADLRDELASSQVLEPAIVKSKGRPVGSLGKRKLKGAGGVDARDPSAFELYLQSAATVVESLATKRARGDGAARRCGRCGETSHNVRTCPKPP